MRIAVLSDIHGNLPALEAVWAEMGRERGPDRIVNLGDIASGPLWPLETVRWLMLREAEQPERWTTIAGNHERQLLAPDVSRMGASDAFAARALGAEERAWLSRLRPGHWLSDEVLLCHGTPSDDLGYFMETVIPGFAESGGRGARAATPVEVNERAAQAWPPAAGGPAAAGASGVPAPDVARTADGAVAEAVATPRSGLSAALILCGHTHMPRAMAVAGGPLVVNPGSVGLPAYDDEHPLPHVIECGSPHARWAIVERDDAGAWHVQLRLTPYDWATAAARAEANGRGDWADALATGVVGRTEAQVRPGTTPVA